MRPPTHDAHPARAFFSPSPSRANQRAKSTPAHLVVVHEPYKQLRGTQRKTRAVAVAAALAATCPRLIPVPLSLPLHVALAAVRRCLRRQQPLHPHHKLPYGPTRGSCGCGGGGGGGRAPTVPPGCGGKPSAAAAAGSTRCWRVDICDIGCLVCALLVMLLLLLLLLLLLKVVQVAPPAKPAAEHFTAARQHHRVSLQGAAAGGRAFIALRVMGNHILAYRGGGLTALSYVDVGRAGYTRGRTAARRPIVGVAAAARVLHSAQLDATKFGFQLGRCRRAYMYVELVLRGDWGLSGQPWSCRRGTSRRGRSALGRRGWCIQQLFKPIWSCC